jgi:hypothetical protein
VDDFPSVCADTARRRVYFFGGAASAEDIQAEKRMGGYAWDASASTLLWQYDVDNQLWSEMGSNADPSTPPLMRGSCMCVIGDRLFLFGGEEKDSRTPPAVAHSDVWIFDLTEATWQHMKSFGDVPTGRRDAACCVLAVHDPVNQTSSDRVLIFGGFSPRERTLDSSGRKQRSAKMIPSAACGLLPLLMHVWPAVGDTGSD